MVIKSYATSIVRPVWGRMRQRFEAIADQKLEGISARIGAMEHALVQRSDLEARVSAIEHALAQRSDLEARVSAIEHTLAGQVEHVANLRKSLFASEPSETPSSANAPFMETSNCQAADFFHPRYKQLCKLMAERPRFHRKQWEWVYILHHVEQSGLLRPGARGLGFGVGREPLPAVFASLGVSVTATDAPADLELTPVWDQSRQHSNDVSQLLYPDITPDHLVREKVTHRSCDMNHIDPALVDYDFNWSSCCFEHLGSLDHGIDFIVNATEKTLKVGGLAVHTTEYNASSNDSTLTSGATVIFRRQDMERLIERLRERGHEAKPLVIGPTAHELDYHVDVPPYSHDVHLKLLLAGYVTTSIGVVVRRGR